MMAYKRREEKVRIGSELSEKPVSDFEIFEGMRENKVLRKEFTDMQNVYVFNTEDMIDFDSAAEILSTIKISLLNEEPDI